MKLILNGTTVPKTEYETSSVTLDIQDSDENDRKQKSVTQQFTFTGATYELCRDFFIDNPAGKMQFMSVKIMDEGCCEEPVLLFEGILRGGDVGWCDEECSCTAKFTEHTEQTKKYDCVQSTLIYDNHAGIQQAIHPRVLYCIEMRPAGIQYTILAFGVLFNLILLILGLVVGFFSLVIQAINGVINSINNIIVQPLNGIISTLNGIIPGSPLNSINPIPNIPNGFDGDQSTTLMQEYQTWIDNMNQSIVGCGRVHPTPYLRDYITNVCTKCGLQFQSSILNSPSSDYYDTGYFSAPVEKGTKDDNVLWIDANKPIISLAGLLAKLRPVFSADWDINGNTLRFEREDYFWTGDTFMNYAVLKSAGRILEKACYEYREDDQSAYARFEYQMDALDWCGNEAKNIYNNIIEWNQPVNELQKGEKTTMLEFGMARFRGDEVDQDVIGEFVNVPFLSEQAANTEEALILPMGTAWLPKLLILNGQITDARVRRFSRPGIGIMSDNVFNYPYTFSKHQTVENTAYPANAFEGSLYKRFHAWKNPKLLQDKGMQFTFKAKYNCEQLTGAATAKYVQLPEGIGRIKKITVDLNEQTITITGHI